MFVIPQTAFQLHSKNSRASFLCTCQTERGEEAYYNIDHPGALNLATNDVVCVNNGFQSSLWVVHNEPPLRIPSTADVLIHGVDPKPFIHNCFAMSIICHELGKSLNYQGLTAFVLPLMRDFPVNVTMNLKWDEYALFYHSIFGVAPPYSWEVEHA